MLLDDVNEVGIAAPAILPVEVAVPVRRDRFERPACGGDIVTGRTFIRVTLGDAMPPHDDI